MPKIHNDFDQRSEVWQNMRLGIPTASEFHRIITPLGKKSEQWKGYAHRLIAEKMLKRQIDDQIANSPWVERGSQLEAQAVLEYEAQNDRDTQVVAFVTTDDGKIGCSPDRLVGDDGLLELKCPAPQTQVAYLIDRKIEDKYRPQVQGQLLVTGRQWVDLFAYHPEMPFTTIRVERDEVFIRCLEGLLKTFTDYVAEGIIGIADHMILPKRTHDATTGEIYD